jgi:hypothetical protein
MIVDKEAEQTTNPDSAIVIMGEEARSTVNPDSAITIVGDEEQTPKLRRTSRHTAKRSFKDFVRSDGLWMGRTLSELDVLKLTDDLLESSERVIKKAKIIRKQLIDSQKFIRDCGGKEEKVTSRLEKL